MSSRRRLEPLPHHQPHHQDSVTYSNSRDAGYDDHGNFDRFMGSGGGSSRDASSRGDGHGGSRGDGSGVSTSGSGSRGSGTVQRPVLWHNRSQASATNGGGGRDVERGRERDSSGDWGNWRSSSTAAPASGSPALSPSGMPKGYPVEVPREEGSSGRERRHRGGGSRGMDTVDVAGGGGSWAGGRRRASVLGAGPPEAEVGRVEEGQRDGYGRGDADGNAQRVGRARAGGALGGDGRSWQEPEGTARQQQEEDWGQAAVQGGLPGVSVSHEPDALATAKIGFLGDSRTGKTCFVEHFLDDSLGSAPAAAAAAEAGMPGSSCADYASSAAYAETAGVCCRHKAYQLGRLGGGSAGSPSSAASTPASGAASSSRGGGSDNAASPPVPPAQVLLSFWELSGGPQYQSLLPHVCNGADAIVLCFDLTRTGTLHGVKSWLSQARDHNKSAVPVLLGTCYDAFVALAEDHQQSVRDQAFALARSSGAMLFFCSPPLGINVHRMVKALVCRLFGLSGALSRLPRFTGLSEPVADF